MRALPRWVPSIFSMEARNLISYRFDFWVQFLGPIVANLCLAYFLWSSVFATEGVQSLKGYTFGGIMSYYLLVSLVDRVVMGNSWRNGISTDIYEGSLSRFLVYPISYLGYRSVTTAVNALFAALQLWAALALFVLIFGMPTDVAITPLSVLTGTGIAFYAAFVFYFLFSTMECVAFWADTVWSLHVMTRFALSLLGGGYIPLSFFPDWATKALAFTPFPAFISLPVRAIMGRVATDEILSSLLVLSYWGLLFALFANVLWRRGLKQYSGVGI